MKNTYSDNEQRRMQITLIPMNVQDGTEEEIINGMR